MGKDIEYLAGLFDGEGCFCIQVSFRKKGDKKYIVLIPRISVGLKYGTHVLEKYEMFFGGKIYTEKKSNNELRMKRWQVNNAENCRMVAETLQSMLIIKSEICKRFLFALSLFPKKRRWEKGRYTKTWTLENVIAVANIAMTLNPGHHKPKKYIKKILSEIEDFYA